ncbi:YheT family hydrolase [Halodesulfovibrio spirochaetisodalis]|uniref:Alpha/beta hydrolase n=1 Tax=Halodesulfovibrio spirochaetisodalis TaxID=1560234 RepID=A0A1B7XC85_9BACT|nr:alpha/beta fold hydrolase [Halodesulfovibrio spirochaetisodalis]OBQ51556.1 alpha/beta hydrolase [Halodesulfovibrio spirochaetisodalis]
MPIYENILYPAPFFLRGGHAQTLYPALFRTLDLPACTVQRITTPDNDFLDIDFHYVTPNSPQKRLAVVSHGLEGNSKRSYIKGMVRALVRAGWDAAAWNFRGCSGSMNRTLHMYHSGSTEDLHSVVSYCAQKGYEEIVLIGFSMGGNQILNYLGHPDSLVHPSVQASVVFSVPCDLVGAAKAMDKSSNAIYLKNFMRTLKEKVAQKHEFYPDLVDISRLSELKTFRDFDETYTAPWYGFKDALEYWEKASSIQFLDRVRVPTLLISARNDPFLWPTCYPTGAAHRSKYFYLETPSDGGHIGFVRIADDDYYWSEIRAMEFLGQVSGRC